MKTGGPARITTVFFDGDGTLWDFEKVMREALGLALQELEQAVALPPDSLSVDDLVRIREEVWREWKDRESDLAAIRRIAFQRSLEYVGVSDPTLAARLSAVYLKHRTEHLQIFDDVLPTLDALQVRYRLGILSNGNSHPDQCGLAGRFQWVVFSQEYGMEKPDPGIFRIALELAGCNPKEVLHVGDSLPNDVAGANAAGLGSVWLNRNQRRNPTGIQADFELTALTELVEICDRLT